MKSLYKSYNIEVASAYIIYLPNNSKSVELATRCLESCQRVGQKAELYEGFDGTGSEIKIPKSLQNESWIKWIKISDHLQSLTEIAVSLSHLSLYAKCLELDQPIIILEHDAIMVKPYQTHPFYNAINYLGCKSQINSQLEAIPPMLGINHNWRFINKAHAYCVDPPTAKKLFLNVLDRGIYESADVMIKCDDVAILQNGFYAYEDDNGFSLQTTRK